MSSESLLETNAGINNDAAHGGSSRVGGIGRADDDTLRLGRQVALSLGTDSLIVLDEKLSKDSRFDCCGLSPGAPRSTRPIPYYNVLWAELSDIDLTVHFALQKSKTAVKPSFLSYFVDKGDREAAANWVSKLLERAYGESKLEKRIKVLVNPFGGTGSAQKLFTKHIRPIFETARCLVDVEVTQWSGHAATIVEEMDIDSYDVVACCSGDGVPHEVFNGLGRRSDAQRALAHIAVVQLPCGTGNAMSLNLNGTDSPSLAALSIVKGLRSPLDLISISQGSNRILSFLSQAVGIVAEVDLGTENIRWMGSARFTYGFLTRIFGKTVYPVDLAVKVAIDSKDAIRDHYAQQEQESGHEVPEQAPESSGPGLPPLKYGTVNDELPEDWTMVPHPTMGNFYVGNMGFMAPDTIFFPAAMPNDGLMDMICIDGNIKRWTALQSLLAVEKGGHFTMEHVRYRKVLAYRIIPRAEKEGYISIDGEKVPFEPFQAELHPGLGTVLSKKGACYEIPGVGLH